MPEVLFPVEVVAGIPVVRTCEEIDVTNAPAGCMLPWPRPPQRATQRWWST